MQSDYQFVRVGRQAGRTVIVLPDHCAGEDAARLLDADFQRVAGEPGGGVTVLDLRGVEAIDGRALHQLARFSITQRHRAAPTIVYTTTRIDEVIDISGLSHLFDVVEDEDD